MGASYNNSLSRIEAAELARAARIQARRTCRIPRIFKDYFSHYDY